MGLVSSLQGWDSGKADQAACKGCHDLMLTCHVSSGGRVVITDVDVVNGKSSEADLQVTSLNHNAIMISDLEQKQYNAMMISYLILTMSRNNTEWTE